MITKSKFIKGLWFVEVDNRTADFDIYKEPIMGYNVLICFTETENREPAISIRSIIYDLQVLYSIRNLKNPKSLFLTKLATEEDWKDLLYWRVGDSKLTDGLSLLKAEGLDNKKNYLIIKEEL